MLIRDAGNFEEIRRTVLPHSRTISRRRRPPVGRHRRVDVFHITTPMHSIIPLLIGWGWTSAPETRPAAAPHSGFRPLDQFLSGKPTTETTGVPKGLSGPSPRSAPSSYPPISPWTPYGRLALQWEAGGTYLYYLVTGILIFYCLAGTTLIRSAQGVLRRRPFFGRRKAAKSEPYRGTGYKPPQRPGNTHRRSGNFGGKFE